MTPALPIVPGCLALVLPGGRCKQPEKDPAGNVCKVIEKLDHIVMADGCPMWRVDVRGEMWCIDESHLMRIDGEDFTEEDAKRCLDNLAKFVK